MRLTGAFTIAAPVERVWAVFMDPATLCSLAASCESARQLNPTQYEGVIRVRVALLSARVHVLGTVLQADPPQHLRVALEGYTTGMPGSFRGVASLWLRPVDAVTGGEYVLDLDVLGRFGGMGQQFFQSMGQRLVHTFADKVSQHLADTNAPRTSLPR